ncbi:2-succinyl-5-enolpyruvyl-6-hydroxy-3-cyclohexene-1-carboxylic-acid synthase [Rathayibacter sp. VKM Ac-2927]|uniref:2-succinyl-5-enolpyruvyl-6-hydroxy-3- cyclohexene-1-carboxylic-acid synthase n=1 Tax=Rathayibacter sp. VKM Ac-2927 TaxID=2929478 RepID=UPI001FB343E4|nr:2-succinyl-5-enolpyruvyl-6-hydroxy-3-cyclohexene-1-carboxylic-acid synthase [Rathayibacter sp. VKM Ac-2927]MCJ1686626.1 2-succinyl-5-enolpyruvyl-6-hydroxy-3-cyclohexene-1-carboxylic-acid synthase [Rathayibacter sp. VKM Ac-2927]
MPDAAPVAPSTRFAVDLLTRFVALGVRDVVVSPGSRSQALALVAAELETRGRIRLHVRIDERSAGFLALGLALETGSPAVLITTSGTATANLHPAVLEADASDVPLIVLTADRPGELRGIRSNQTTDQVELFGRAVRLFEDVAAPDAQTPAESACALADRAHAAASRPGGPVHLNLAFRDPLSSRLPAFDVPEPGSAAPAPDEAAVAPETIAAGPLEPLTVVIAGDKAGAEAEALARAGDWPLLAEVSSGARFGPQLVVAWRRLLAEPGFGGRVRRAIVLGHPTLSREVPELLRREDVEVIVVDRGRREFYNPGRRARSVRALAVVRPEDSPRPERSERAWPGSWVSASRALVADADPDAIPEAPDGGSMSVEDRRGYARNALTAIRAPLTREFVVAAVWRVTWPHDRLLFGASRLIRVADGSLPGKRITVHSNRGLAGIDGTVSTALGIAVASQSADAGSGGATRVVLGDLTLLHEAGGLLLAPGERRPRVQLVVVNDGGGTIFDGLEVATSSAPDAFDRVQFTPQTVDIASLATAYGWSHRLVATRGELEQALTSPGEGPGIVEIALER